MKYYLIKLLTNTAGQDGSSIATHSTKDDALVAYHNLLAALHNAADVLYSVVEIMNEYGNIEQMEVVDHKPEPPEPGPEPEE